MNIQFSAPQLFRLQWFLLYEYVHCTYGVYMFHVGPYVPRISTSAVLIYFVYLTEF